jgi:hypothetical protein
MSHLQRYCPLLTDGIPSHFADRKAFRTFKYFSWK